jgi:hypothetical protein
MKWRGEVLGLVCLVPQLQGLLLMAICDLRAGRRRADAITLPLQSAR